MTTTTTVRFDAKVKRRDINKLKEAATAAENRSNISIELSIVEYRKTADVHVEINGDGHQAAAFTTWVQAFAIQPTY